MAYFRYKLIDTDGRLRGGFIDLPFDNPVSAMTYLERQGGTVLFAEPLPGPLGSLVHFLAGLTRTPVTPEDLAEALSNLAVMVRAGIPALTALRDTFAGADHPTLRRVGKEMVLRIESGATLAETAKGYPWLFPNTVLFLLRVGEESGTLDRTMHDAAAHVKRTYRIISDVKRALIYPAVTFTAIFGALGVWLYMVVPVIMDLFRELKVEVPPLTEAVVAVSSFAIANAPWVAAAAVGVVMLFGFAYRKFYPIRRTTHLLLLKTPLAGRILHTFNIAYLSEYLALLHSAGVDMLRSLDIVQQALGNEIYREKIKLVREELIFGRGLRSAFHSAAIFPSFVVRMVGVGEESGTLSDQLSYVADEYRYRLEGLVETIGKLVEPLALVIGGFFFGIIIFALFVPIYQAVGSIGGG